MKTISLFLLLLTLTGCQSFFSSNDYKTSDEKWLAGKELSEKGEKVVSEAQEGLKLARKTIRDGESMIQSGKDLIESSKLDYKAAIGSMGASVKPDQVKFEAKKLNDISTRWSQAVSDIKEGNKIIKKGNKMVKKNQSKVFKGREIIAKGSALMVDSQNLK